MRCGRLRRHAQCCGSSPGGMDGSVHLGQTGRSPLNPPGRLSLWSIFCAAASGWLRHCLAAAIRCLPTSSAASVASLERTELLLAAVVGLNGKLAPSPARHVSGNQVATEPFWRDGPERPGCRWPGHGTVRTLAEKDPRPTSDSVAIALSALMNSKLEPCRTPSRT